jgi:ATP-dependent exoDNAse (exonuclease V) beta subunit
MAKTFEPFTTPISAIDDVLLLSASAGTGKTWMVTHLAARWLIEEPHHDASQVLLVTFTKNAASELKYRLRERVIEFGEVLRALTSEAGNRLVINPLRTSQQWDELMNAQWVQGLRRSYGPRELSDMLDRQIRVLQTLDDANARTLHSFASLVGQSDEREHNLQIRSLSERLPCRSRTTPAPNPTHSND